MPPSNTVDHEPSSHLSGGVLRFWIQTATDISSSASLGWRIFVRDFSARYRQQAFGILWAFLGPALTVVPFVLLVDASILDLGELSVPYPIFAFAGAVFWSLVQGLVLSCAVVVSNAGALVTKIHFPREALLFSPLLITLVDFAVKVVILVGLFLLFGFSPGPWVILHFFAILPAIVFALGLGLFAAIVGGVFKDAPQILTHGLQALMFVTPILYPVSPETTLGQINVWNPFYYLVSVPRDLVVTGHFPEGTFNGYLVCCLIAVVVFLGGLRFYRIAMLRVAERA